MTEAFAFQGCFLLWMKHFEEEYPKSAVNTYPLGIQAVAIVSMILAGIYMDRTNRCIDIGILCGLLQLVSAAMLVVPNLPAAGTFFAFYLSGTSFMVNPILYGWGGSIARRAGDDAGRAVILYTMNTGGQLLYTWWGIVLYPATDAPYWKNGAITLIIAVHFYFGGLYLMYWLDNRTNEISVRRSHNAPLSEQFVCMAKFEEANLPEKGSSTNQKT